MASSKSSVRASASRSTAADVPTILATLERSGSKATRVGMARYGIHAPKAFGVTVAALRKMARDIGTDHSRALALWNTGWYEAKLLACFTADAESMTAAQMDSWTRDFDNWAVVDTACFHLFDRSPHAWRKIDQWSRRKDEFVRRAAFALLASLALHDKQGPDAEYAKRLETCLVRLDGRASEIPGVRRR
jgi:3-methyladenine DNA glycosylase AlkD